MYHLRQLECAQALARHQHVGRAAQSIGITQSGLTQSINRLEDYYGVKLFARERKPVTATVFGEALLKGAAQVLERMATITREIALLNNLESGQLVVGVDPMLATSLLGPALTELLRAHPQLRFSVRSGGWQALAAELSTGSIDVLVGFPEPEIPAQFSTLHFDVEAPLIAGAADHPLSTRDPLSLSDFLAYPLVQGPIARWYLDWAEQQLGREKVSMDLLEPYFLHADDTGLLISIAQRSNALLAAMRADLQASLDNGLLVEILPPQWPASVPVTLAWSADAPPPAAERLIQELQIVIEADRNS